MKRGKRGKKEYEIRMRVMAVNGDDAVEQCSRLLNSGTDPDDVLQVMYDDGTNASYKHAVYIHRGRKEKK